MESQVMKASKKRAVAKVAKAIGQLYEATRGRGPHWDKAVAQLGRAMAGRGKS